MCTGPSTAITAGPTASETPPWLGLLLGHDGGVSARVVGFWELEGAQFGVEVLLMAGNDIKTTSNAFEKRRTSEQQVRVGE